MTSLMIGDSIAVAAIIICVIFLYTGSKIREGKDNKVFLFMILCACLLFIIKGLSDSALDSLQKAPAAAIEALKNYTWFVFGILSSIVYSYSFVPEDHGPYADQNNQYKKSIYLGLAVLILGFACFFLHTIFPDSLYFGALNPIGSMSTSLGGTLLAAAAVEDAKLNPDASSFALIKSFFKS